VKNDVAPPPIVIAGLDPAIQPSAGVLPQPMDARVKPAHDNERLRGALGLSTALAKPGSRGLDRATTQRPAPSPWLRGSSRMTIKGAATAFIYPPQSLNRTAAGQTPGATEGGNPLGRATEARAVSG
jgi:hypothetical protein